MRKGVRLGGKVFGGRGEMAAGIAGVHDAGRLDQDNVRFALSKRAVLDAAGYNEELSGPQGHVAIAHLDGQSSARDKEELVGVIVGMPNELAVELDHLDLIVVHPGNHLGRPLLGEEGELFGDINGSVVHSPIIAEPR
jgi:hypothetical protein